MNNSVGLKIHKIQHNYCTIRVKYISLEREQ